MDSERIERNLPALLGVAETARPPTPASPADHTGVGSAFARAAGLGCRPRSWDGTAAAGFGSVEAAGFGSGPKLGWGEASWDDAPRALPGGDLDQSRCTKGTLAATGVSIIARFAGLPPRESLALAEKPPSPARSARAPLAKELVAVAEGAGEGAGAGLAANLSFDDAVHRFGGGVVPPKTPALTA